MMNTGRRPSPTHTLLPTPPPPPHRLPYAFIAHCVSRYHVGKLSCIQKVEISPEQNIDVFPLKASLVLIIPRLRYYMFGYLRAFGGYTCGRRSNYNGLGFCPHSNQVFDKLVTFENLCVYVKSCAKFSDISQASSCWCGCIPLTIDYTLKRISQERRQSGEIFQNDEQTLILAWLLVLIRTAKPVLSCLNPLWMNLWQN